VVAVIIVVAPADTVPSPHFNDKPRVTAFIILLPEVDRGGIMKVGLEWILVVMPCPTLVASGLLYFLFIVATRGWVALVALAVVIPLAPGASSGDTTNQHIITMMLRPRGLIPSGRHWMLPVELHEHTLGQVLQPLYLRIGWELLSQECYFCYGADRRTVLAICDCCKSVVKIPWFAGTILRAAPALSALGVLCPPDPSVLLVFILGSVSCGLIG
jgi:hypothetical protein